MSVRILHVVGSMNCAGTETWLMHVARHIDRRRFRMDFLVHSTASNAYDQELQALGCRVIPCLGATRPWQYAGNFRRVLRECGPYDIVHSHVHHYSGFALRLAHAAGVSSRIVHSHSDTLRRDASASLTRRAYLRLSRRWIQKYATTQLACSREAATALFGPRWKVGPWNRILHCGIDLTPFSANVDRTVLRRELGITADACVLGHVGRFVEVKNHRFLVEVAAELFRSHSNAVLLLVGDGPLRQEIERKAAVLGISNQVVFAGVRNDVARLMLGAMDVFVFPSEYEGLGLASVEAQSAGVPCVLADSIPAEADVVGALVHRVSLSESPNRWADVIWQAASSGRSVDRHAALNLVRQSNFNIATSVAVLEEIYRIEHEAAKMGNAHAA